MPLRCLQVRLALSLAALACALPALAAPGYKELAAAIRAGELLQVEELLQGGASPSTAPGTEAVPLLLASSRGKHDIVRLLLARGASPDVRFAGYFDATPLMLAINNRDLPMAKLLLEGKAQVNLVDRNGDSALNWACFYGDLPAADLLLQYKADATLVGHGNALEVAMRRGHQPVVERLVDVLALRQALRPEEQRLVDAIDAGDAAAAGAALAAGAEASRNDATGRALLARAARLGRTELVQLLLKAGAPADAADRIGFTALFEAARQGHAQTVAALLKAGADPKLVAAPRGLLLTALHVAAGAPKVEAEVLRLLVGAGAPLNAKDKEGATPLLWAVNADVVAAITLVDLGADPDLPAQDGSSPRKAAAARELKELQAAMQRRKPV